MERRAEALRKAIRKHSGAKGAELPVALIENSSRAPTNDSGEKLLGNKRAWLPALMSTVRAAAHRNAQSPGSLCWPSQVLLVGQIRLTEPGLAKICCR